MTQQQLDADMSEAREQQTDASWVERTQSDNAQLLTFEAYSRALYRTHQQCKLFDKYKDPTSNIQFDFNPVNRAVHSLKPTVIRTFDEAMKTIDDQIESSRGCLNSVSLSSADRRGYENSIEVYETFKSELEKLRQAEPARVA